MSRRRSTRLQAKDGSKDTTVYDDRLGFLRDVEVKDGKLPIRARFEHRIDNATGPVEVVYWPAQSGSHTAPEQLTLFILGEPL